MRHEPRMLDHQLIASLILLLALLAVQLTGCGGPPREARIALEETAGGLVLADDLLADQVERKGEEARSQVRREVREGTITGATPEDTVAAGLARFDLLMEPLTTARTALRAVLHRDATDGRPAGALAAVEAALDAWEAGTGDAVDFARVAACAGIALSGVVEAISAADVDIPSILENGVRLIRTFASATCSEGR